MTEKEKQLYDHIISDVLEAITLRTADVSDGVDVSRAAIIAGVALEVVAQSITDVLATKSS
ncbi:hypothetical protein [Leisingera sp.]|uniref:hypothetical protein n=1 Tax=Leisingera sp. TaxID=1879318 RepID=UPI002B26C1D0|nr:hypothetical protein [Leisingera sp.]